MREPLNLTELILPRRQLALMDEPVFRIKDLHLAGSNYLLALAAKTAQ
jgi:hypothetical protein